MEMRIPTSIVLENLLRQAPAENVTLDWLIEHLSERSFGIVMLLVGLVALVPGISPLAGLLLGTIAFQMILGRPGPIVPRVVASRRIPTPKLARLIGRLVPVLKRIERLVRPRWRTPFEETKRAVGVAILLLSVTLLAPIPLSQVVPALAIMLLALAFLESDGILLCIALSAAVISICITVAAAWGTIEATLAL